MRSQTMVLSMVLAAGAATIAGVGTVATTAEAAPSVSPFAGNYAGQFTETVFSFAWDLSITISASGGISGAAYYHPYEPGGCRYKDTGVHSAEGSVTKDGAMRLRLRDDCHRKSYTLTAELDANGNLLLLSDAQYAVTSTLTRQ